MDVPLSERFVENEKSARDRFNDIARQAGS